MITIAIVSDIVCPWCFIGKRRLAAAIALVQQDHPDFQYQIRWLPFFLNPDTPPEGEPYLPFLEKKFVGTSLSIGLIACKRNKHVSKEKDEDLYDQVAKEVDRINRGSEHRTISVQKVEYRKSEAQAEPKKLSKEATTIAKPKGFCIRTGVSIPFSVEKPFSAEAFKSWSKFGNPDYSEKFCHFSGEPSNGETSLNKPILKKNWKKAKEIFNL